MMNDFMVDLETMATTPDAAIVAIGAVAIDLDKLVLGPWFYAGITLESNEKCGRRMSASTIRWWLKQGDEARLAIAEASAYTLSFALHEFTKYLDSCSSFRDRRIWGNGVDFDNVILANAYHQNPPWSFRNNRCFRTVKAMFPMVTMEYVGVAHNALADATNQANHLIKIQRMLGTHS